MHSDVKFLSSFLYFFLVLKPEHSQFYGLWFSLVSRLQMEINLLVSLLLFIFLVNPCTPCSQVMLLWLTDVHICSFSYLLRDFEIISWSWGSHVAQEMAALCSLAFIRRVAMLEDFRSGSMFRSYPFMPVLMPGLPNKLPMCVCPMWPPGLGTPKKSDTPLAACGWGGMQELTESQGTTQPGTGDAALLLPIQEGFWICNKDECRRLKYSAFTFHNLSINNIKVTYSHESIYQVRLLLFWNIALAKVHNPLWYSTWRFIKSCEAFIWSRTEWELLA